MIRRAGLLLDTYRSVEHIVEQAHKTILKSIFYIEEPD